MSSTPIAWQKAIEVLQQQHGVLAEDVLATAIAALQRRVAIDEKERDAAAGHVTAQKTAILHATVVTSWLSSHNASTGKALTMLFELQMRLKSIATEHGGVIARHAGYDVIALFCEETSSMSSSKAVQVAQQIRREVQRLNLKRVTPPYVQTAIHFSDETLHADTPSTHIDLRIAREIKDTAAPNEILLSYAAYRETREQYSLHFAKSGKIDDRTLRMYRLVNTRSDEISYQNSIQGVTARLIGRQDEQTQLQTAVRRTIAEGQLQMVVVAGEPGMGKSRLMREFYSWLEVIPEKVVYFSVNACAAMQHRPFGLLRSLMARRAKISVGDTRDSAYHRFTNMIVEIIGDEHMGQAELIADVLGFGTRLDQPTAHLDHLRRLRDMALNTILDYMHGLMQRFHDPMVITIEDIHYIDENSLQFLQELLLRFKDMPVTLVATCAGSCDAWPLRAPVMRDHRQCLTLQRLQEQSIYLLIAELLRNVSNLEQHDTAAIADVADGNPGAVWEHIRWLIARGTITVGQREWRIVRDRWPETTPTLAAQTTSRLQQLATPETTVLQAAAVIGQSFWEAGVKALLRDMSDFALSATLQELCRANIIKPYASTSLPGSIEYAFEDARYCQIIAAETPPDIRQQRHAAYATWLIASGINRNGQYSGTIAHHFEQAQDVARAAKWYLLAARQSFNFYAPLTAAHQFAAAYALIQAHDELLAYRFDVLDALGAVHYELADYAENRRYNHIILSLTDDPMRRAAAFSHLAKLSYWAADLESAWQLTERAQHALPDTIHNELHHRVTVWVNLNFGMISRERGNFADAQRYIETAMQAADAINEDLRATCLEQRGLLYMLTNELELATVTLDRAQTIARRYASRRLEARLLTRIGTLAQRRGDTDTARYMHRQALTTAQFINSRFTVYLATIHLSYTLLERGEYRLAAAQLRSVVGTLRSQGITMLHCAAVCALLEAELGLGNLEAAHTLAQESFELTHKLDVPLLVGRMWRGLGLVAAQAGSLELDDHTHTAEDCFMRSIGAFASISNHLEKGLTLRAWGIYAHQHGQRNAAHERWRAAIESVEEANATLLARKMRREMPD